MNPRTLEKLSPWLFTIAIFLVWELSCIVFKVNTSVLQPPSAAFAASLIRERRRSSSNGSVVSTLPERYK